MSVDAIIKAQKEKKLIIGMNACLKALKSGKTNDVFITKTCSDIMKRQLKEAAELARVKLTELAQTSEELSALLKKPFTITVAAIASK
jgi:ribosomal protein L30E